MVWTIPDKGEGASDLQSVLFQSSLDAIVAGFNRTGVITGCAVTAQGTPDMTVAVAAGFVMVAGTLAQVSAGNVTIGAADSTNPRLDLVVANSSGVKSVIAGTAAANPKEPTLDTTTYVLLAQVYIPAAATTITTARITDRIVSIAMQPLLYRLAADATNSATTAGDGITSATLPVGTYEFLMKGAATLSATSIGYKHTVDTTGTASEVDAESWVASSSTAQNLASTNSLGSLLGATTASSTTIRLPVLLGGTIKLTAVGAIKWRFAPSGVGTATLLRGSDMAIRAISLG